MTDRSAIHVMFVEPETPDAVVEYVRQVQQWRRSALDHGAAWATTYASGG